MPAFRSARTVDDQRSPMFVFRPRTAWVVGVAAGVALVLWVVIEARQGAWTLAKRLPQMAVFGTIVYAVFVRPCVEVDPNGVTVRNVVRDVRIPFRVLADVGTEFSLRLTATSGRTYQSWSAPAASRITQRKVADPHRDFPRYPTPADLPVDTSRSDADSIARVVRKLKSTFDREQAALRSPGEVSTTWPAGMLTCLAVAVLLTVVAAWWG